MNTFVKNVFLPGKSLVGFMVHASLVLVVMACGISPAVSCPAAGQNCFSSGVGTLQSSGYIYITSNVVQGCNSNKITVPAGCSLPGGSTYYVYSLAGTSGTSCIQTANNIYPVPPVAPSSVLMTCTGSPITSTCSVTAGVVSSNACIPTTNDTVCSNSTCPASNDCSNYSCKFTPTCTVAVSSTNPSACTPSAPTCATVNPVDTSGCTRTSGACTGTGECCPSGSINPCH